MADVFKPIENNSNPLLQKVRIPGVHFRVPSGGLYYAEGVLDSTVSNGEVVVFPMSTIDELTIRNVDGLINGTAVYEVFGRCIPQIKRPDQLLARDVDYLLIALKKMSYGNAVEFEYQHDCETAKTHSYAFNLGEMIRTAQPVDPTSLLNVSSVTLPNDQRVELKPIIYSDFVEMLQNLKGIEDKTENDMKDTLIKATAYVVQSVDGISNRDHIFEWLKTIPREWFNIISSAVDKCSSWGVKTTQTFTCEDCGKQFDIDMPINPVTFFT